ncbi:hypothetical protein [Salipiger thiooxidans]|uniref:hypothetical protein n=1 Tax=Salipiger thiooxidans TaxID=282683 RepID=UPI001CD55E13|nr:hypothetical protein [Salipiger thiooxidans]MCA0849656.1 hypothetical protein [Salipiger thiooxidans]
MKVVQTLAELFYEIPLYESVALPEDLRLKLIVLGGDDATFEGYCPECETVRPFKIKQHCDFSRDPLTRVTWQDIVSRVTQQTCILAAHCTFDESHSIRMVLDCGTLELMKIGQYPSLADIGNSEIKRFRGVLSRLDMSELHKAIGLGAHGVGVGSFTYLRRIFERIIQSRFDEFHQSEGWDPEAFRVAWMDEKIAMIRSHIPEVLYENRKIYAVLSKGIHELSEEECLAAFPWLKKSIIFILDDDLRKRDELRQRDEIRKALGDFL